MKPFTLEWWIHQLAKSFGAYQYAVMHNNKTHMNRYRELAEWIKYRMIKKYGEQA